MSQVIYAKRMQAFQTPLLLSNFLAVLVLAQHFRSIKSSLFSQLQSLVKMREITGSIEQKDKGIVLDIESWKDALSRPMARKSLADYTE